MLFSGADASMRSFMAEPFFSAPPYHTPGREGGHGSGKSTSDADNTPLSNFLNEWVGIHGGRVVLVHVSKKAYDRLFLENSSQLLSYIEDCAGSGYPAYMSVQPFKSRDQMLGLEKVFFDFDCKEEPEKAWVEARDFALKLKKYYGISPLVVFSGQKGYHVYAWLWSFITFQPAQEVWAKEIYRTLQDKLLKGCGYKTLDAHVLGDIKRLSRIPYSIHEKTSKTCQPVDLDHKPIVVQSLDEYKKHGVNRDLFKRVCQEVKVKREIEERRKRWVKPSKGNIRPCIRQALSNHNIPHLMRAAIVTEYAHAGASVSEIIDLLRSQADFNEERTKYQVEHVVGKRGSGIKYKTFRCKTIQQLGFCLEDKCPLYNKRRRGENG